MTKKIPEPGTQATDPPLAENVAVLTRPVEIWCGGQAAKATSALDSIARETAIALIYNDISHAVMMASPQDLEAFALGFSLTEGIVSNIEDIYGITIAASQAGTEVSLSIASQCFVNLKNKRRNLTGRTGCGICGAESLQQLWQPVPAVTADFRVDHSAIARATRNLAAHQPLQTATGACHAAAWCDVDGTILCACEDVGRHNALDKLIGQLWQSQRLGQDGILLITSRASYEIVQKSAMASFGIVVAVSAPTSLAIEIVLEANITLVGFSRDDRHIAYTHDQRLRR